MKIIKDLEERQPSNYVAVICSLLDLDDNGRRFFARSIEKLNRKAAKDKKTHDFSIMYRAGEERRGLTAFVSAAIHPNELHKRLAAYCVIKKYREHASEWLGLGRVLELPGSFHVHVVVSGEWEFDAKLEEILEGLPRAEGFALTPRPRGARADTA